MKDVSLGPLYELLMKATPEDAAYAAVKAAQLRQPELHYPYWFVKAAQTPVLQDIFRWIINQNLANLGYYNM